MTSGRKKAPPSEPPKAPKPGPPVFVEVPRCRCEGYGGWNKDLGFAHFDGKEKKWPK